MPKYILTIIILFHLPYEGAGQSFIGELFIDQYTPVEIIVDRDTLHFEMSGKKTYRVTPKENHFWHKNNYVTINNSKFKENHLELNLQINGVKYNPKFYKRNEIPIDNSILGGYRDPSGKVALIYQKNKKLIFTSPYSRSTSTLHALKDGSYWSESGEKLDFSDYYKEKFRLLRIKNRFGSPVYLDFFEPYEVQERYIPIGKDSLFAKIFFPVSGIKKQPACLFLPGGGSSELENYEFEAMHFAASGFVSLIFNKPGEGKSKGPGDFRTQTFLEKSENYIQIFNYLKKLPGVDSTKVGLHGLSEGGRIALIMGKLFDSNIAFIIASSSPLRKMAESQIYAIYHYHEQLKFSPSSILEITSLWNHYFQDIQTGLIQDKTFLQIKKLNEKYPTAFLPPVSRVLPLIPSKKDLKNNIVLDTSLKLTVPVLLQYGSKDKRVNPLVSNKMHENIGENVTIYFYKGADHNFTDTNGVIIKGYLIDKLNWVYPLLQ